MQLNLADKCTYKLVSYPPRSWGMSDLLNRPLFLSQGVIFCPALMFWREGGSFGEALEPLLLAAHFPRMDVFADKLP